MADVEELKAHAAWLSGKMEECREAIGEDNVVFQCGGGYEINQAYTGYLAMAKEYRLTIKQLADMGELNKEEKENTLSNMRILFNKKAG